jgi:hypothetical protein
MSKWEKAASDLVTALDGETDEQAIAALCKGLVVEICSQYSNLNSRRVPLTTLRKAVSGKFPDTTKQTAEYQYFTNSGKGKKPRWEHLALKYLTLSEKDWDALGGEDRAEYKASQQQTETIDPQPTTKATTLTDMNIDQLELDPETKQTVETAITQSGMELADFVKKALQVYAKTVTGKTRKHEKDLTTVPTEKLLNDKEFSTHPGRAEELTKRAIRAMTIHNDEIATEKDQKWCITQTAISGLIGARASSIKKAMEPFKVVIDDHNSKHELNDYSNRKNKGVDGKPREIYREIDLCNLVPDGLS